MGQADHGDPGRRGERGLVIALGRSKDTPSGEFTASLVEGPEQDGVATRVVVVTDDGGREVFRDDYAYSTRHGVGVTWLSSADQLWILSADVGTAHVDRRPDGTWTKTADTVPDEIDRLR